jgi:PAS domain S-box-containing protein
MNKSPVQFLIESGVYDNAPPSLKRSIVFSNYIALILSSAGLLLFVLVPQNHNFGGFTESMIAVGIFCVPILLNRFSFTYISRLYLCWVPPLLITWAMVNAMKVSVIVPTSSYAGLRTYLVAASCIPYLLMDRRDIGTFILGILPTFLFLLFNDYILNKAGVGYAAKGTPDVGYVFMQARSLIAYVVIGGSCLSLRLVVDKSDRLNQALLDELDQKNKMILRQAAKEVSELDNKLYEKLEELKERDFILGESQRMAKIGSWRFQIKTNSMFWSEEMYNIFGVEKNYELTVENVNQLFDPNVSQSITLAYDDLVKHGKPLDLTMPISTPLGHKRWLRINGFPLYKGEVISGALGICHDITFYKEAEERLALSEKKYRSLFEQASDAIMITDLNGNFLDVNSSLCTLLRYKKEDILRLNSNDIIDSGHLPEHQIKLNELNDGIQVISERMMIRSDGSRVPVESNIKKFREDALFVIARDISERKETAQKLKKHIRELALLNTINAVSAKADDVVELLKQVSSVLIREGNYKLVWIGKETISDTAHVITPLITMGDSTEYIRDVVIDLNNENHRKGPGAKALLGGTPGVLNQYSDSADYAFWNSYASTHGIHASLGIAINAAPIGCWVLNLYSPNPEAFDTNEISVLERVAETVGTTIRSIHATKERDIANYQLKERVKELITVRRISELLNQDDEILDDVLLKIVHILPPGWQYPEITAGRITVDEKEFKTFNFSDSIYKQLAEFQLPQGKHGTIEVVYLEEKPIDAEGPFLTEERNLINMIAEMLSIYFAKRHESMALKNSEANLSATVNNTDILIWSIDTDYKLITFNAPFFNHIKKYYGLEVRVGTITLGESTREEDGTITNKWNDRYRRVLTGEKITLEENRFGIDFYYSLAPISGHGNAVTGVNIFATNITTQKQKAQQLAEANKEIGELKLTALRSVMNPHFIFNALNSIQFFIAANDRLNAINYLSKFSKLIRSVLTSSVNNKIKLGEEIEILKNYVQLEVLRFEGKFEFNIDIDANLETDTIEIPSLLVQPYVENAIIHGLYNKQSKGHLNIRIYEQQGAVVFEIEDDGVGREAATKIREENLSEHKSMGTKLTEERLKLINESHNVSFQIMDLMNGKVGCGTRVTIWIKL